MGAVVVPPMYQLVIVGSLVAYLPVELGHTIVHPALLVPQQDISIQLIVVLQTIGTASVGVALLVTIDAERRNAHLDPRLDVMDGTIELFHKEVDIMAPPVTDVLVAPIVSLEECRIRYVNTSSRIGIEIVVDMQSVNIVACQDVTDHLADEVTVLLDGRIQQRQSVILEATLRIAVDDVVVSIAMRRLRLGTIGVDPCVQLHATLMTLINHPLQGVPIGLRCPTLLACQIIAPRLQLTLVERITLRAHLEDDGIAAILSQLVQLIAQRLLHLQSWHALKLSVDTLYPCSTELTLLLCLSSDS